MNILGLKKLVSAVVIAVVASAGFVAMSMAQEQNLPVVSSLEITRPIEGPMTGVNFDDPHHFDPTLPYDTFSLRPNDPLFRGLDLSYTTPEFRDVEMRFSARSGYGFTTDGRLNSEYQSRELRIGRNIDRNDFSRPAWYLFVADENEALIWDPNVVSAFGRSGSEFSLQDQVEIGDLQVGVAYDWNGIQTTFSYVEREIGTNMGSRSYYEDENFVGFTFTYRHNAP